VTVSVASSDTSFVGDIQEFVDSYNALRDKLAEQTAFNATDLTTGLLFGTNAALRVDADLSRLVTDRFFGLGSFETLAEIGITVDDGGKLQLDKNKLQQAFADNPSGLKEFFTNKTIGVVAKFSAAIDQLAGADNSLLSNRVDALQSTIDANQLRIEQFNKQLDQQRERLLAQFSQLEKIVAGLKQSQSALSALSPIPPLSISNSNSR